MTTYAEMLQTVEEIEKNLLNAWKKSHQLWDMKIDHPDEMDLEDIYERLEENEKDINLYDSHLIAKKLVLKAKESRSMDLFAREVMGETFNRLKDFLKYMKGDTDAP